MFIAKANSFNGQWINAVQTLSNSVGFNVANGNDIATDCQGNIYITGSFTGTTIFGPTTLTTTSFSDALHQNLIRILFGNILSTYLESVLVLIPVKALELRLIVTKIFTSLVILMVL